MSFKLFKCKWTLLALQNYRCMPIVIQMVVCFQFVNNNYSEKHYSCSNNLLWHMQSLCPQGIW